MQKNNLNINMLYNFKSCKSVIVQFWPSWKLPIFKVKKLPKPWHFFENNCQKLSFFIFWKKKIILAIKKNQDFCNFLTFINGNFPEGQLSMYYNIVVYDLANSCSFITVSYGMTSIKKGTQYIVLFSNVK